MSHSSNINILAEVPDLALPGRGAACAFVFVFVFGLETGLDVGVFLVNVRRRVEFTTLC